MPACIVDEVIDFAVYCQHIGHSFLHAIFFTNVAAVQLNFDGTGLLDFRFHSFKLFHFSTDQSQVSAQAGQFMRGAAANP